MLRRTALAAAAAWSLFAPGLAGEATPASDQWYAWSNRGRPCGYAHLLRKASGDKQAPVLLITVFEAQAPKRHVSLKMQTFCRDDAYLTPVRIVSEGEGDDELGTFDATIDWSDGKEGLLRTELRGEAVERRLPEHTVTDFALFEIVRRLPFTPGVVFEFHAFEACELLLKRNHKITCLGTEELTLGGRSAQFHKFEQTGDGIRAIQYWVDDEHNLVRVVMDGRKEWRLATMEEALAALKDE